MENVRCEERFVEEEKIGGGGGEIKEENDTRIYN
jgi:hypothetical protein